MTSFSKEIELDKKSLAHATLQRKLIKYIESVTSSKRKIVYVSMLFIKDTCKQTFDSIGWVAQSTMMPIS